MLRHFHNFHRGNMTFQTSVENRKWRIVVVLFITNRLCVLCLSEQQQAWREKSGEKKSFMLFSFIRWSLCRQVSVNTPSCLLAAPQAPASRGPTHSCGMKSNSRSPRGTNTPRAQRSSNRDYSPWTLDSNWVTSAGDASDGTRS